MNKHLYRIIFNKRRGQLMVVSESAASQGKAPGEAFGPGGAPGPLWVTLRPLCLAVLCALGQVIVAPAYAQIVADPNAPGRQRPTVLQTANGVVQVNIQSPSAAGVSRNSYSQFDVQSGGVILNNSRADVQSQTGGWVQGNPWLAGGAARVILNEVNSSNPSLLRGYVEVAGQRAELIIANPAGVSIDGAGFINASGVTITTGVPQFNAGGGLDGYLVRRGAVTVDGRGLDTASSDFTSILARAVQVNAGIWANDLRVVTGPNQVAAGPAAAAPAALDGAGAAPPFALDVAQLGGMYAGKITLLGTESGLGVRNAGVLAASAGDVVLQANGWLSNSGNIQATAAGAKVRIDVAGDIGNSGTVYSGGDTHLASGANIGNTGLIAAHGDTALLAGGGASRIVVAAGAVVAAGLNADNTLRAGGDVQLRATDTVAVHGSAVAGGAGALAARQLDLSGASVSGASLALTATEGAIDASRAGISATGDLTLAARQTLRTDGASVVAQQLGVAAHDLSNVGGQILQLGAGELAIQTPGDLDNSGGRIAGNSRNLTLGAATLNNAGGTIEHAGAGTLAIDAGRLKGRGGKIIANGGLELTADDVDHRDASIVAGRVAIRAGALDNRGGAISQTGAGQTSVAVARTLDNAGAKIESNGDVAISAAALFNAQGRITSTRDARVGVAGDVDNRAGTIVAAQNLALDGAHVDNTQGTLQGLAGNAALRVVELDNHAGGVYAGADLSTLAVNLNNSGSMYAAGRQTLNASGAVVNTGVIAAQGDTSIAADSINSGAGSLLGAGVRTDGLLAGGGALRLNAAQALAANGQNLAAGKVVVDAAFIDLGGSQTSAANIALTATAGTVSTANATVNTPGTLAITAKANAAQALDNSKGSLSAGQLDLDVANLGNQMGNIVQTGAGDTRIALTSPMGVLDNTRGRIAVNSDMLSISAAALKNRDGAISAGADMQLRIDGDLRNDGQVYSGRNLNLNAGALDNAGAIAALGNATIKAGSINSGGLLGAGVKADGSLAGAGNLNVTAAHALHAGGQNLAAGDAVLSGATVDLSDSQTSAANIALTATSGDVTTSKASIATTGILRITANANNAQALVNREGKISAGQLALNVANLNNAQGDIAQTGMGDALIKTGAFDNTDGRIAVNSKNLTLEARTLNNVRGKIEHAGAGTLAITAASLDGQRGQITGNGALDVKADYFDHRGASTIARQVGIAVGTLDNRAGDITQIGDGQTVIRASQKLGNADGSIATNGAASIAAGTLDNSKGRITSGKSADVSGAVALNNADGTIAAGQDLNLSAGDVDNTRGSLRTVAGNVTLQVANLNNAAGKVFAGADLRTTAGNVKNGGDLYAAGNQTLLASGAVVNTGMIAAQGNTDIRADSVSSGAASLLGAGIKAGGGLAATGTLSVNAAQGLAALGQNLAAGDMALRGASVDVAGSQTSAANIAIAADSGNVNTGKASVSTPGTLEITAGAQTWNNGEGKVSAGQLSVAVANLNNTSGTIVQTGTGDTSIALTSPAGTLNNSMGRIAVNSRNLTVNAGSVHNVDGTMEHAGGGTFAMTAVNLGGQGGHITANGALDIRADAIDHRGADTTARQITIAAVSLDNGNGRITQLGDGKTRIALRGNLNNGGGTIASNGDASIGADSVNNQGGTMQAAGAARLDLNVAGALDNRGGNIAAAGNATVVAAAIQNQSGKITAGDALEVNAAQAIQNAAGLLAANGDVNLAAASFDNAGGKLASVNGNVRAMTAGATANTGGKIQAGGNVSLSNAGLDNSNAGLVTGVNVTIDTRAQTLNNRLGTIAGTAGVNLQTGAVHNDAGLIQAGAALAIDTHGQALNNGNTAGFAARGISSGGSANLAFGNWNNAGGYFGAVGRSSATAVTSTTRQAGKWSDNPA